MTVHDALNVPREIRLTGQDFVLLLNNGAFEDYAGAELIAGEIFVVNAQFRRHAAMRRRLMRLLEDALTGHAEGIAAVDECNVAFDDHTMPQPDITLTSAAEGEGPIPLASVRLIVEIADTTLDRDLGAKRALYARFGIAEYWVVDVEGNTLHQHWSPLGETYAERRQVPLGQPVAAATIPGLSVGTAAL